MFITNTKNGKSFKVVNYRYEPIIQFMPMKKPQRNLLYRKFQKMNVSLPVYDDIDFDKLFPKEDLIILCEDFEIFFKFKNKVYYILAKKGLFFDGASVPDFLSHGKLSRINCYSLLAALVHDILYATKVFPRNEADDIFEGLLRYKQTPTTLLFKYMLGLRLGGWVSYNRKNDQRKKWFSKFSVMHEFDIDDDFEKRINKNDEIFCFGFIDKLENIIK